MKAAIDAKALKNALTQAKRVGAVVCLAVTDAKSTVFAGAPCMWLSLDLPAQVDKPGQATILVKDLVAQIPSNGVVEIWSTDSLLHLKAEQHNAAIKATVGNEALQRATGKSIATLSAGEAQDTFAVLYAVSKNEHRSSLEFLGLGFNGKGKVHALAASLGRIASHGTVSTGTKWLIRPDLADVVSRILDDCPADDIQISTTSTQIIFGWPGGSIGVDAEEKELLPPEFTRYYPADVEPDATANNPKALAAKLKALDGLATAAGCYSHVHLSLGPGAAIAQFTSRASVCSITVCLDGIAVRKGFERSFHIPKLVEALDRQKPLCPLWFYRHEPDAPPALLIGDLDHRDVIMPLDGNANVGSLSDGKITMQAQVDGSAFADAVANMSKCAPANPSLPALKLTRVDASNGTLVIECTDMDVCFRQEVQATVETPGEVLVNSQILAKIMSLYTGDQISISVQGEALVLVSEGVTCKIQTSNAVEWPFLTPGTVTLAGVLDASVLQEAVKKTAYAVGHNKSARLRFSNGNVWMCCTNKCSAAIYGTDLEAPRLLVNAKAFGTAAKLLVGQVQVSTFQSDNLTVLHMQDAAGVSVSLVTDSLKPPLPIKDVIAEHQGNLAGVAQVDRVSFVRAASVVQKAAAKKAQVELAFNQSEITLSAGTTLRSVDADTTASVSGKVNPALLAKAVRACTGKTIQVELFTNGDKAGVAIVSDENSRHVILSLQ